MVRIQTGVKTHVWNWAQHRRHLKNLVTPRRGSGPASIWHVTKPARWQGTLGLEILLRNSWYGWESGRNGRKRGCIEDDNYFGVLFHTTPPSPRLCLWGDQPRAAVHPPPKHETAFTCTVCPWLSGRCKAGVPLSAKQDKEAKWHSWCLMAVCSSYLHTLKSQRVTICFLLDDYQRTWVHKPRTCSDHSETTAKLLCSRQHKGERERGWRGERERDPYGIQNVTTQRGEKRRDIQASWALGDLGLQQAHLSPPFCPPGAESGSSQAMGMEGMNPCPPSNQF